MDVRFQPYGVRVRLRSISGQWGFILPAHYDSIHDVNLDFRPLTYNANQSVEVRA